MRGGRSGTLAAVFRAPFLIAVLVLVCAAIFFNRSVQALGTRVKEEIPLKAALGTLNKDALLPFKFHEHMIMEPAIEASLGAKDYIDWLLIDPAEKPRTNPLRFARLTITYHSGGVDMVPHVPDQCYQGQGYSPVQSDNIEIYIPSLGRKIPLRVLTFQKGEMLGAHRPTVMYLFHCNGDFVCTRNDVRYRINDLSETRAYFSKIEISFGSADCVPPSASREDSIDAATKLLDRVLPVLVRDHLPDWEKIKSSAAEQAEKT